MGSFQRAGLPGGSGVGRQAVPLAALRRQATCLTEKPSPAPKAFFLRFLYAFTAKRLLSMPLMLLASPRGISKWRKVGRHMMEKNVKLLPAQQMRLKIRNANIISCKWQVQSSDALEVPSEGPGK